MFAPFYETGLALNVIVCAPKPNERAIAIASRAVVIIAAAAATAAIYTHCDWSKYRLVEIKCSAREA